MSEQEPTLKANNDFEVEKSELSETPDFLFNRYPDVEKILAIMEDGEVRNVTDIDEYYEEVGKKIPTHMNDAYWSRLHHKTLSFKVQFAGQDIQAIFKPKSGEDMRREKRTWGVENFYIREAACYEIDQALKLGLIPPTIVRDEIKFNDNNGEKKIDVGSLRLFVPSEEAEIQSLNNFYYENMKAFTQTEDWQAIAVLDYLIANADRHLDNLLYSTEDPLKIYPIDNALCLKQSFIKAHLAAPRGPRRILAFREKNGVLELKRDLLPRNILVRISSLNQSERRKNILKEKLERIGLPNEDVSDFFSRLDDISRAGIYL